MNKHGRCGSLLEYNTEVLIHYTFLKFTRDPAGHATIEKNRMEEWEGQFTTHVPAQRQLPGTGKIQPLGHTSW